jgi:AraC-like DNA-binding protein
VREFNCEIPTTEFSCSWHYHAEYELVLYEDIGEGFTGHYFAGEAINSVQNHTMLLYGPGLPHMITGRFSDVKQTKHRSVVVWFTHDWIEKVRHLIPEARYLSRLIESSAYGVRFSQTCAKQVAKLLHNIEQLERHHQAVKVIEMLMLIADDKETERVSSGAYRVKPASENNPAHGKITKATRYIEKHYGESIKIENLCRDLHISESSAYRLFEKHYGMSFSEHLKQYRIGKACEMLASTDLPIALVAEKSGFTNLSNFNRLFKGAKAMTPSQFRRHYS